MAAADGRFNRIGQVTPMCPPMRAHCLCIHHLVKGFCVFAALLHGTPVVGVSTIELVLPSAHPSPQPKRRIVDWFSRFCTAHGRKSLYVTIVNVNVNVNVNMRFIVPPLLKEHGCIT